MEMVRKSSILCFQMGSLQIADVCRFSKSIFVVFVDDYPCQSAFERMLVDIDIVLKKEISFVSKLMKMSVAFIGPVFVFSSMFKRLTSTTLVCFRICSK